MLRRTDQEIARGPEFTTLNRWAWALVGAICTAPACLLFGICIATSDAKSVQHRHAQAMIAVCDGGIAWKNLKTETVICDFGSSRNGSVRPTSVTGE